MGKLIMMMGIPGAGKSTWIKNNKEKDWVVISRDAIRFEMLEDGEEYFSREEAVFSSFIHQIIGSLVIDEVTVADATHLTKKARAKVLNKVRRFADEIEIVWLDVSQEIAIERNDQREGRAVVPHEVIRRMFYQLDPPELSEGFAKITVIEEGEEA